MELASGFIILGPLICGFILLPAVLVIKLSRGQLISGAAQGLSEEGLVRGPWTGT